MANLIDIDAQIFGENKSGFGQQHVKRLSNGDLYAVQINDASGIEIHKSVNNGTSWTIEQTYAAITSPKHLTLASTENDDLFLSYIENASSPYNIVVKKRNFGTTAWSEVLSESVTTLSNAVPYAMLTFNGAVTRLHLVWINNNSGKLYNERHTDDKGSTWSTVVDTGSSGFTFPVYLFGVDTDINTGNIYLFLEYGISVKHTAKLSSSGAFDSIEGSITDQNDGACFAVDSSGNRYLLIYRFFSGTSIYTLELYKNTVNIFTDNFSTTDTIFEGMLSMGIDGDDNIHIFYTKKSDNKCYTRKWDSIGSSMGSESAFTTGDGIRPSSEQRISSGSTKLNTIFYTS